MTADVILVVVALALGGLVKATLGFGAPLVAIPILALGMGSEDAVILMAIPGVAANAVLTWTNRAHHDEAVDMWTILIASVPAAIIGSLILSGLPDDGINLLLAGMLFAYLAVHQLRPGATLAPATRRWLAPVVGLCGGVSQGAAGISLPWFGPYLHSLRLSPGAFTHEICAFFLLPTLVQMVTLAVVDEYDARRVGLSVLATAVFLLTLPAGARIRRSLTPDGFRRAVLWMLGVAAVALTIQGLA